MLPDTRDHIAGIIHRTGDFYERDLLEDIFGRVHRGLAIDVGAHIGNHTLWFALVMRMQVVALEPNPRSFAALQRNLGGKRASRRVTAYNAAAGATPGSVRVVDAVPGNSGMTRCEDAPGAAIQRVRIDDLPITRAAVTLIKADVEGDEIAVLEGAANTIAAARPAIYAEAATPEAAERLDAYMAAIGYVPVGVWGRTPVHGYLPGETLPARPAEFSVAIMAHPARSGRIPALLEQLDYPAAVVLDHHQDRWETGRRALLAYDPGCTHHMVIQDDAVVPDHLMPMLKTLIRHYPDRLPMSLYLGAVARFVEPLKRAVSERTRWVTMPGVNWGVGLVVPTADINALVAFCDTRPEPNYDLRISRYFESLGRRCWYPLPSLVDHQDGESLVPGRFSGRHAWRYVGADATVFDGAGTAVHLDLTR